MADWDDKITYSDIITPDDSINKLISQLEALNGQYTTMINAIKAGAKSIVKSMKDLSGATKEGREALDESAIAASRLERAQKELIFSTTEIGKQIAALKSQTTENNKVSAEHAKWLSQHASSYNRLKTDISNLVAKYKALSESERANNEIGGRLLETILNLKARAKEIDDSLKLHIATLTETQKAEQRLAFLQTEEGQRLLALKKQINEVIAASRESASATRGESVAIGDKAAAQEKLNYVSSEYYRRLQQLNLQANEAARISKLQAQLKNSETGSYNKLAAQYELNKIKLNAMSAEERKAVDVGQKLEAETRRIYQQMIILQEATGNHRLSVGNYAKAWNGLGNAMNQIVREVPSMTMGINMFFLAISNNVPILIDEIQRVQRQNALLRAEGRPTEKIMKTIANSLFSWQTALIGVITVLSMKGKDIFDWFKRLGKMSVTVKSTAKALNDVAKELEKTNDSYGQHLVTFRKLQDEWTTLTTDEQRKQFIKDYTSEINQLDIAVRNIDEAENALINNTEDVLDAFRLRAKAAAAEKLAAEQYEKALTKRNEAETITANPAASLSFFDVLWGMAGNYSMEGGIEDINKMLENRIENLNKEADAAEADAESYYKLQQAYLSQVKIDHAHKQTRTRTRTSRGRQPRDLTDIINRNDITLEKKYEESITKLQNDEYVKRRKALQDTTATEIRELLEKQRKNEEYIANTEGKYKELTEEQKKQILQQQDWINKTITNKRDKLQFDLLQLEKEHQMEVLRIMRETIDWQLEDIESSIEDEKQLKLAQLSQEENLIKAQNLIAEDGGRDENEITAEYAKKRLQIISSYDNQILAIRRADIEAQLQLVQKGANEELELLLEQNEIARQLALSENRAKPAAQQQSETQINQLFDKKATTITTNFKMTGFDQQQAVEAARFNTIKHTEDQITKFTLEQERERWIEQIRLAKAGALDWSEAQIEAAELTVKGIDRELSELNNIISKIGKKGLGYTLLESMGFDDDAIDAANEWANIVIENLQAVLDAEVEFAEKQVELAEERVSAAQSAYEAEIEARNNGYANNVATAKKELQLEKKNQQQKQKMLEQAQRRQEAINTITQASSLITASANIWSSFSSLGVAGPFLAAAAIAAMWGSFAAAKTKARQVTQQSQEYGEGGLEFLEGGSHASGNDIDLQTKNRKGKNMRAEGGEALAIINKCNTRKYRKMLPDIIDSLNKGSFEDKYLNAFAEADNINLALSSRSIDLSTIERELTAIRKQSDTKMHIMPNGDVVIIEGNVKRVIRS